MTTRSTQFATTLALNSLRDEGGIESLDGNSGENGLTGQGDLRRASLQNHTAAVIGNVSTACDRQAIEALPLFTTVPIGGRLETVGFVQRRREGVRWTWPIWSDLLELDTCRSLLQLADLEPPSQKAEADDQATWRDSLSRRGIAAVFQSQRITIGKFRNFTPARAL